MQVSQTEDDKPLAASHVSEFLEFLQNPKKNTQCSFPAPVNSAIPSKKRGEVSFAALTTLPANLESNGILEMIRHIS